MRASSLAFVALLGACGGPNAPGRPETTTRDAGADSAALSLADASALGGPKVACAEDRGNECREACIAGGIAECSWYVAAASADPDEKVRRALVSCDASVGHSPKDAILMCTFAGTTCWDPPEGGGCTRLLDAVCEISLLASECRRPALIVTRSTYDANRAGRVLEAIVECKGPACSYNEVILAEHGAFPKDFLLRVAQRIEERCAAGEPECKADAWWVLRPKYPQFDAARAARVADSIEKLCTTGTEEACLSVFLARAANGAAPKPARAFEIAEKECAAKKDECELLALCYAEGNCGKPKDAKRAITLYEAACKKLLASHPSWTREDPAVCRKADELKGKKKK